MKKKTLRTVSFLLILTLLLSNLALIGLAAQRNTGTRHEPSKGLSSQAVSYYSKNGFDYNTYITYKGDSSGSCLSAVNSELYKKLQDLMTRTMTNSVSYSSLTSYWPDTDCTNGSNQAVLFYSDQVSGNYNREHVWPKSRASFLKIDGGCDLHHLRPTNSKINSTRSNFCFGNVRQMLSNYSTASYGDNTVLWYNGSYMENASDQVGTDILGLVEVNDNIKGDVARILLYVYVRWGEKNLFQNDPNPVVGPSDNENNGLRVIYDLNTLLQWCKMDPVDSWEMSRNDATQSVQGNRNIFIDYPQFAWYLFGRDPQDEIPEPSIPDPTDPTEPDLPDIPTDVPVAIHNVANHVVMSNETMVYTSSSGSSKDQLKPVAVTVKNGKIYTDDPTVAKFYVDIQDSGIVSFLTPEGKYLEADGNNLRFVDSPNENTEFVLEAANGGYYIRLANYLHQGTKPQYIEYYTAKEVFTLYGMGNDTSMYIFDFCEVLPSDSPIDPTDPTDPTTEPTTKPTDPTVPGTCTHSKVSYTPAVEDCFENGTAAYYLCTLCGGKFADEGCTEALTDAELVLPPQGHKWDEGTVSIPSTATEYGLITYTCLRCEYVKTTLLPPGTTTVPGCDGGKDCPSHNFVDAPDPLHWAHKGIDYAVKHGLFSGMSETRFEADLPMTRAMLVNVLWRSEGKPMEGKNEFSDVPSDAWHANSIAWAAHNGIVYGIGDGTFAPDKEITREQIATILFRYAAKKGYDITAKEALTAFPDAKIANDYALEALQWAVAEELIQGVSVAGVPHLDPLSNATRGQVATILMRFLEANQ